MDKDFQDRIDRFLLHGSEMTKEERAAFLGEIENDEEKKAQYQFTIMVRDAMRSRMSKLEAMKVMEYFDHVASADNAPAPNPCMPNNMPCPACPPACQRAAQKQALVFSWRHSSPVCRWFLLDHDVCQQRRGRCDARQRRPV